MGGFLAVLVYWKLGWGPLTWGPPMGTGAMPGRAIIMGWGPPGCIIWGLAAGGAPLMRGAPGLGAIPGRAMPMAAICWGRGAPPMPGWAGDLGGSEEPLGLRHGGHEVSAHAHLLHASHALHPHAGHALDVLGSQVSLAVLLPLGQSHVQRLGDDDAAIHLSDGLGGLLRGREAHESESLGATLLAHNPGGGDGSIRSKLLSESLIVDGVIQILDIQVSLGATLLAHNP